MTDNTERAQIGWGFWLWWVLASAVGLAVAGAADDALSEALDFVAYGVPIGVTQWLVLRRQILRAGWWILATLAAFAVGDALGLVGDDNAGDLVGIFLIGITQWIILRRQVSRAGWWVLAIPVGWAVGLVVLGVIKEAVGLTVDLTVGLTVTFAVGGTVIGAITGAVLVRLLRQPTAKDLGASQAAE